MPYTYYYEESPEEEEVQETYECAKCRRNFVSDHALKQHLAHSSQHNYCFMCNRDFGTIQALQNHLDSSRHNPDVLKTVKCPTCGALFDYLSSLVTHMERNSCPNLSITRTGILNIVRRWEAESNKVGLITNKAITNGESSFVDSITPNDLKRCLNGNVYECPMCNNDFRSVNNLYQHLMSKTHAGKDYRCIVCKTQFVSPGDVIGHLEKAPACRKNAARSQLASLTDSMGGLRV
eukprot:Platyproteum_vivax@DN7359_c0_g1_i2.p1